MPSTFFTLVTSVGLAKIANAIATGDTVELTEMAVGDGNGNPTTPTLSQTELVRETYRAPMNQLIVDPSNPSYIIAEMVIPTTVGGWTIHEVGIFDNDGSLIAVANFPATYKPELEEGSGRDLIVRIYIEVANTTAVTLVVDPAVVLASREWVQDNFSIAALLPGGTTGQVLKKVSNADGDTEWAAASDAVDVLVNVVEEEQTLSASQTHITLATCTTNGLAIYVEGARLGPDDWTADGETELDLAADYPAGTGILFVQNDPNGAIGGTDPGDIPILELVNGIGGLPPVDGSQLLNLLPRGCMQMYAGAIAPDGWLSCDGSAVSRTTYADLFAILGTTYGAGDLSTTFNVPDLRGRIPMGAGTGAGDAISGSGKPAGAALAARTRGQYGGAQTHTLSVGEMPAHTHTGGAQLVDFDEGGGGGGGTANINTGSTGGGGSHNNVQPFTVVNFIIKH